MKTRTLEEIIRAEQENRHEGGAFGIDACKRSIRFSKEELGEPYAEQLEKFVQRANEDAFFNKAMVLACYELMQEEEAEKAEANAEAETEPKAEPTPGKIFGKAHDILTEDKQRNRSAWGRGVTAYALELLAELEEHTEGGWLSLEDLCTAKGRHSAMLNGASDWAQYSWGGCSLIYNSEIAERLCTPSELKRTRGGEWRPNSNEEWLDTQARALHQASRRVSRALADAIGERAKGARI